MRRATVAAVWAAAACAVVAGEASPATVGDSDPQTAAAAAMVTRLVGADLSRWFTYTLLPASACGQGKTLCFGYHTDVTPGGQTSVALKGTTGVELSMAFNHYAKYQANSSVSWWRTGGDQLVRLRQPLPRMPLGSAVHVNRATEHHYYANVCTFSYSFVWYQLEDWVREIDWMALNGVNLPLAYTGQEKIYQKVYNSMGVTDEDLKGFFGGPAFLAWARGQGEMGWGGPLPQAWIDGQWELQRKILPLMRAFGMKPVLPAFQGNVPLALMKLHPKANISRVGKCETAVRARYACAPWMDALDPLFNTTADLVMRTVIEDFGTDHYYAADGTFSTVAAPWYDDAELAPSTRDSSAAIDANAKAHSTAAYNGMARTDPDAKWIFQTWSWIYGAKQPYMQGWIEGAPLGRLILLDLMAEETPIWKRTDTYYGAPFIWCMLHDFGGNTGMWGDPDSLSHGPTALAAAGKNIVGTGLTMEGTNQNAVVYEFMNEMAYRIDPVASLEDWAADYAARRYAFASPHLTSAWRGLFKSVYNAKGYNMMISKDTITAIPEGSGWDQLKGAHWYNESAALSVWADLLAAKGDARGNEATVCWTYYHDVADVTRQAIAKYSTSVYARLNASFHARDVAGVKSAGADMVRLAEDSDAVMASTPGFLTGTWVQDAERWGLGDASATRLMSWNARTQITFWEYPQPAVTNATGPVNQIPFLMDYANKQWAGLMKEYYGARWAFYVEKAVASLEAGHGPPLDVTAFHVELIQWYEAWRERHTSFPTEPVGDTHAISSKLFAKYAPLIRKAESLGW